MIKNKALMWAVVIGMTVIGLTSCKLDMPKETETSFETMTVDTTDIETPVKFSAKMKGRADVTISPQVSGQLMKIYVTEGQQVRKGQTLFVIDAGNEVNEALDDCQAARDKHGYYHRQVEVLHEAYKGTHELMDNGKSNYLEVLTAQETLLSAQLSEAMNMYSGAQAVIALYIALGGGMK